LFFIIYWITAKNELEALLKLWNQCDSISQYIILKKATGCKTASGFGINII